MAVPEIDLRSDTVTKPTPAMRTAMVEAEVGDDVICVDPTVEQLQDRVADLLGKEAALFMPSGSMANQIALRVHCQPGDEFLCEADCHIYNYEQGAFAQLSGLVPKLFAGQHGIASVEKLHGLINPHDDHATRTKLVTIENTHNRGGGSVQPQSVLDAICGWAAENQLKTHLDGARLFNAEVAVGVSAADISRGFDSVSVCFSKGLGAPVGSALAGSAEFIRAARRARKLFGGGMRQVGILAAGALYALEHHRQRMAEDHLHAKMLAAAIRECDGLSIEREPETNIVLFRVDPRLTSPAAFVQRLAENGVGAFPFGVGQVRLVTHLGVSREQIERAAETLIQCSARERSAASC